MRIGAQRKEGMSHSPYFFLSVSLQCYMRKLVILFALCVSVPLWFINFNGRNYFLLLVAISLYSYPLPYFTISLFAIPYPQNNRCEVLSDIQWPSKAIQRTFHPAPARPQHVRVNHRRRDVIVAKQLLNGADVCSTLQCVGRERMPKSMAGGAFSET